MFLDQFLSDLPGVPRFRRFRYRDTNPLTGTTKYRAIGAPNEAMRLLHQRLVQFLRQLPVAMPHAIGARPNGSPVRNVMAHCHFERRPPGRVYLANRHFYLLDIVDAYGHVDPRVLAEMLCQLTPELRGYVESVQAFLSMYCFVAGSAFSVAATQQQELLTPARPGRGQTGLIQGSPSSPDLFNLYAALLLDAPLAKLCRTQRLTYTRYLDDLTFSARWQPISDQTRRDIRALIAAAGFGISHRKAKIADLHRGPVTINGVSLDRNGRVFLPRWYVRKLRGLLHAALQDPTINPARVHGQMGVFLGTLPRVREFGRIGRNQTERKLVEQYAQYRTRARRR